jgi:ACS family glucarate transporter-like MFS transporter
MLGFALAAVGLLASIQAREIGPAIAWFSLAIFGADMTITPSWSVCIDIGRKHSGAISGTMNMAGNLGSFVSPLLFTGLWSRTGSEESFFVCAAALNVAALVAWIFVRPERTLEGC